MEQISRKDAFMSDLTSLIHLCREVHGLSSFLQLDAKGEISILDPVPLPSQRVSGSSHKDQWIKAQQNLMVQSPQAILDSCIGAFSKRFSNTSPDSLKAEMRNEVSKGVLSLHVQPSIRSSYRQFVIIVDDDQDLSDPVKDGVSPDFYCTASMAIITFFRSNGKH